MPFLVIRHPGKTQQRVELPRKEVIIGKRKDCDIVLSEGGVSRRHCRLYAQGNKFFIEDLNSTNGTFVNNRRIETAVPLTDGDVISVGPYTLLFREAVNGKVASAVPPSQRIPPKLKLRLHEMLLEKMDITEMDEDESEDALRRRATEALKECIAAMEEEIPPTVDRGRLMKEVLDEALGLGPLEDLLADDEITEIMVNRWDRIYVEKKGKIHLTDRRFTSNEHVIAVIRRIIAPIGRRIDESSPMVDARLPDGSRVNAIIAPLALSGPTLTIRKFSRRPYTSADLVSFGTMPRSMALFLEKIVENRANICISGGTGSGKTTLLNVVAAAIPHGERIITIEDAAELRLPQEHVVSLESKPPNIAGEGAIPIRQLVINSLRMRPDRIIVGECRGGEALDMLQAMNTGHDGSLTTVHANSARDALRRLETMVLMAGLELPSRAIREQIASAINFIVHLARLPDGSRKIVEVIEITGMEGDTIVTQQIFRFKQTGFDERGKVTGYFESTGVVPRFVQAVRERGIEFDLSLFKGGRLE